MMCQSIQTLVQYTHPTALSWLPACLVDEAVPLDEREALKLRRHRLDDEVRLARAAGLARGGVHGGVPGVLV